MRKTWLLSQIAALLLICAVQASAHFISGNAGIGSAVMKLTGTETLSVTADSKGAYSFTRLPSGSYLVTPSLGGYTFSPASQSVTIGKTSVSSISFTATAVTVTETGLLASPASVTLNSAGAIEQLTVEATYSNESSANVTGSATYASNSTSVATVSQSGLVTAVGNGTATVVASYGGLASSVSIAVSIPSATYSISGSAGVASATVVLSGTADASTTASSTGTFSFAKLTPGSYTITPSLSGYTFSPAGNSTTVTNANVSGVNFTATATQHSVDLTWGAGSIENPVPGQVVAGYNVYRSSVSGGPYSQLNSSLIPGLTYTDTAVSAGQTWYYVCSTVDNLGDVSAHSNQVSATIP
jgi:Big-like domain-containing protein